MGYARAHLGEFEIFAQPFGGVDQIIGQKWLTGFVFAPSHFRDRRFRQIISDALAFAGAFFVTVTIMPVTVLVGEN